MTEHVTVQPVSVGPAEDAVITVMPGPVGAHVGILYRKNDDGARGHLHLAFHFKLKDEPRPPEDALWVVPSLDEMTLADVGTSARLIARKHQDGRIPYAFRKADARFDPEGCSS